MNRITQQNMKTISQVRLLWQQIIGTHSEIKNPLDRGRARTQTALLFILATSLLLAVVITYFYAVRPIFWTMVGMTVWSTALYATSRMGYIAIGRIQVPLLVSVSPFLSFILGGVYTENQALVAFVWITIGVSIVGLLYNPQVTALVALLNLLALVVLPFFITALPFSFIVFPLLFGFFLSSLIVLTAYARNLQERDRLLLEADRSRQQELQLSLEETAQRRARDLALAVRIGNAAARVRELETLLKESADLIYTSFNLYHVHIYLTDAASRTLTLQASTGNAGREFLRRGHRIPIDLATVSGTAATDKRAVIVSDTVNNPLFRPSSLLPDTRSEMAVPLISGNRVMGVLNLQSDMLNGLTDESLPAFEAVAGQLAIAIENANLFAQVSQTQNSLAAQAGRLARQNWDVYWDNVEGERLRYTYTQEGAVPLTTDAADTLHNPIFVAPIKVVDTPIGAIRIEGDPSYPWSQNDTQLVQAVAAQVAQQVENLRLLNEAERYRAEAEAAVQQLTKEGWQGYLAAADVDNEFTYINTEADALPDAPTQLISSDLYVRGAAIGELVVTNGPGQAAAAADMVTAVADRLSAHIENLRLTQQTESALADAKRQSAELAAINRVVSSAASSLSIQESLQVVAQEINQIIDADQVGVALLNEDSTGLEVVAITGKREIDVNSIGFVIPLENNVASQEVIDSRRSVIIKNVQTDPRTESVHDIMRLRGIDQLIIIPLIARDQVLGTVGIDIIGLEKEITPEQMRLAETLVYQASTVVENIQLLNQIQDALADSTRQAQRLAQLNEMGTEIATADSLNDLYRKAVTRTAAILERFRSAIYLLNPDVDNTFVYWNQSDSDEVNAVPQTSVANTVIEHVVETNQFVVIPNMKESTWQFTQTETAVLRKMGVKSFMLAPLVTNNGTLGVLAVASRYTDQFTPNDRALMLQITSQLAAAIENRQLLRQARRQAQRERLVNDITQKIQSTVTMESALQTAVQELGQALQARLTTVALSGANPQAAPPPETNGFGLAAPQRPDEREIETSMS